MDRDLAGQVEGLCSQLEDALQVVAKLLELVRTREVMMQDVARSAVSEQAAQPTSDVVAGMLAGGADDGVTAPRGRRPRPAARCRSPARSIASPPTATRQARSRTKPT